MKTLSMLVLLATFMACNTSQKETYVEIEEESSEIAMVFNQEHPGKQLMENNCYACHNPKSSEESMIAPPMVAVKLHYLSEDISKEKFIAEMVSFIKDPTEDSSRMPGAIAKFGLMPYQFYPENTLRQIADYLFENDVEEPEWFQEHYSKMHGNRPMLKRKMDHDKSKSAEGFETGNLQQLSFKERGMQMAKSTQGELGKNLMGQIQKNGVIAALDFCNVEAMPITDSMAVVHKARLRRVTDKPRNPNNAASAKELEHIQTFKEAVAEGKEINPIVIPKGEKVEFYYPIITNSMCLKCHGTPEKELEKLTLTKILEHYPEDKAIDYGENEVRGVWSIEFEK